MPAATRFLCFRTSSLQPAGPTAREAWRPQACSLLLCQPPIATAFASRPCPAPRRPADTPTLPYPSRPSPPFLCLASSVVASRLRRGYGGQDGGQATPFGHPCRTSRLDSLDLSFVLSHRRGYSPPRSDRKKRRPSEETPSESRPRTVPLDRCRLLSSGPALASLWFGPLYAPATRPFSFSLFLPAAPCRRMHLESPPFSEQAAPPSGGPARSPRSTCKDTHNPRICNARSPVFARAKGCFWPSLWM